MEMMKAYVCKKYGSPEVLEIKQCEKPSQNKDEVLIKIYATSVTNSDIFIRSSKVSLKLLLPFRLMIGIWRPRQKIIGQVFAGEIIDVGKNIENYKVGNKVYGLTGFSLGAYTDYKKMKEINSKQGCFALMPDNISYEEATAAAYGGLLALQSLEKENIKQNDKVLIYGASSTSGITAMQYLKNIGVEVTSVCSESKFDFVKSLGADKVLDYNNDDSIKKLEKYNIIFDCVGKARSSNLKKASRNHIADKKDFISIDDTPLVLSTERLERIKGLVEKNIIKPINDKVFPFEQMVEAHRYVELGHKTGNVAVTVNVTT